MAPDQANIREIIQDRKNGFLFKAGSEADFKRILLQVFLNPNERLSMAAQAVLTIEQEQYLWSSNAEKVLELVSHHIVSVGLSSEMQGKAHTGS